MSEEKVVYQTKSPLQAPRLGDRILLTRTVEELPPWVGKLLSDLGKTDCCQTNKPRQYIVRWDGYRLTVWDANGNMG